LSADLLLAVDGGGTKTQALVTDLEGNLLARGLGPPSNHHRVGIEKAREAVAEAVKGALGFVIRGPVAGRSWAEGRIAAACFGLAGVDSPEDEALVADWVRAEGIAKSFCVVNDTELILAAGTPEGWGVALVGGTGSNCLARSPEGRRLRVGGWGSLLGDEGSGFHIAERALRLAAQTYDGRADARALLEAALAYWQVPDLETLMPKVYGPKTGEADVAGFAEKVLDLAGAGDAAAKAIADEAARDLARHVDTAVHRLRLAKPPLALAGGLLLRWAFQKHVLEAIQSEIGRSKYVTQPAQGAVALARRLLARPR
jgi:N-acetylglucosamine kinase-like BadF-type ATPase